MRGARTSQSPEWRDGFLWLGNQLALDFLNTRPVQNGEPQELLPDLSALLRWFQAAGLLSRRQAANLQGRWGPSERARRVVGAMRAWRERLRTQIIAWERGGAVGGSTIRELNRLLAEYPMRARLKVPGDGPATELYFEPRQPEDLWAPLAHSTASLFAGADHKRVRQCGGCVLHFHDSSKKGTRRWCSMRFCGNRHKVAAYFARQRRLRRRITD
jgi:predicted RNA-binding Zn ribbon-like protein